MNLLQIAGHLGADAEERFTSTGKRVITLRVAAKARQGGKDETNWWRVTIWGDRFDKMLPYLKKGSGVIVVGEMSKPETYVDKNGETQISLNMTAEMIKFSPFGRTDRPEGGGQQQPAYASAGAPQESVSYGSGPSQDFAGDDLPF